MYIAYKLMYLRDEVRREIALFKGITYDKYINCAVISFKGFEDIYLKLSKEDYDTLYDAIMEAFSSGARLIEIKQGLCLGLEDENNDEVSRYMGYALDIQPEHTFDYKIEF